MKNIDCTKNLTSSTRTDFYAPKTKTVNPKVFIFENFQDEFSVRE